MTDSEALQMLVDAATAIDVWYRDGGNANTDRYRDLMSQLGQAVQIHQQRAQTRALMTAEEIGPPPACGHDHRCEDYDTKPGIHYHAHDLPRCRDIAVGSLRVVYGVKFLCQRHIDARLVSSTATSSEAS